jgi:hypothetical protein
MTVADHAQMIADLLAKAEGTKIDAEAEVYREKAYALMTRYSIDQAMIDAKRVRDGGVVREEIVRESIAFHGIFKDAMVQFAHDIVTAFRTMSGYVEKNVLVEYYGVKAKKGKRGHAYTIVGYESDVRQARMLIVSLQLQAMSALTEWWKADVHAGVIQEVGTPMEKFKARREFIMSFGRGAATRVRDRMKVVMNETGPGTEVALVDRGAAVRRWLDENMELSRSRGRGMSRGSAVASGAGYSAGLRANTGEASINPGQRAIGG